MRPCVCVCVCKCLAEVCDTEACDSGECEWVAFPANQISI